MNFTKRFSEDQTFRISVVQWATIAVSLVAVLIQIYLIAENLR